MTEQQIIDLGFNRIDVPTEVSGDNPYYFYEYVFGDTEFTLLSPADTDVINNQWYVEPFDYQGLIIYDYDLLVQFMETLHSIVHANK